MHQEKKKYSELHKKNTASYRMKTFQGDPCGPVSPLTILGKDQSLFPQADVSCSELSVPGSAASSFPARTLKIKYKFQVLINVHTCATPTPTKHKILHVSLGSSLKLLIQSAALVPRTILIQVNHTESFTCPRSLPKWSIKYTAFCLCSLIQCNVCKIHSYWYMYQGFILFIAGLCSSRQTHYKVLFTLPACLDTTNKAAINMYKPIVLFLLGREPREELWLQDRWMLYFIENKLFFQMVTGCCTLISHA